MKVAAVQISVDIGNVKGNVEKAINFASKAVKEGAKILCLPEMFNTGYFCYTGQQNTAYFDYAETLDGYTISTFKAFCKKHEVYVVVPFFEYSKPGVYYNSACLINDTGTVEGVYRKLHIPWSFTSWEKFYITPGNETPVFDTKYGKIGMIICYDRDFPEVTRLLANKGAEVILVPNGAAKNLIDIWKNIMSVRAYENQVFMIGSCLTGKTDEEHHEFSGNSTIVDPFGKSLGVLDRDEGNLICNINLNVIHDVRQTRFLLRDRRGDYSSL